MKSVVISIIIFLLLLGAILGNRFFLSKTADHLSSLAVSLTNAGDRHAVLTELESFWDLRRPFLAWTVPRSELERREEFLIGLHESLNVGDEVRFRLFAALLANASNDLKRFG